MKEKLLGLLVLITLTCYPASPATVTTPNMSLVLPVPGTVSGPTWAQQLNTAFSLLDSHNHSPGSGVLVPTSGLNINADLQYRNFNLVNPRSIMFTNQSSALVSSADTNNVYVVNGNLYFNNGSGTPVQVTSGSSVNVAGVGGITGLGGTTAALTYSNTLKTFTFTQNSGITASIGAGTYNLFENASGTNAISLKSPASLGASYSLTFLTGLPSVTSVLTINNSGNMGTQTYDQVGSNMSSTGADAVAVSTTTAGANSIAAKVTSTGANAIAGARTRSVSSSVGVGGVAVSSSCGTFTSGASSFVNVNNLSVTITSSGRPIMIMLVPDTSGNASYINSGVNGVFLQLARTGGVSTLSYTATSNTSFLTPQTNFIDPAVAGTYTYTVQVNPGGSSMSVNNYILVAYEL